MKLLSQELSLVDKTQIIISHILRISLIVAAISAITNNRWTVLFVSCLTLSLTFLPAIIEQKYEIIIPTEIELLMVLFVYAGLFLGEIHSYYIFFWWWDILLHSISGVGLGFIGFLIMFILYHENKIEASPFVIALFSFCFAIALGSLWEIAEFSIDVSFGTNLQKSGLFDTMGDLVADVIGALIIAIAGFFYIKFGKKGFIINRLLKRFFEQNKWLRRFQQ
ncbi:hypothetical protein COV18_06120 [Candidatus Woesearchaeota archaeon CG10_big_fil_rev_8_21_14_0_10_37_12]|nr:MAG: hypothetical protein COV18_06120 [Candidatus Woesearchaeota archaeon CG10_big_fil_rev_8_21_14_0_10_37_12]